MLRRSNRILALTALGAVIGAACVALAYAVDAGIALEMDRDPPRLAAGFYPVEAAGDETFAWTTRRVVVALRGANRRSPWRCTIRFQGGRPPQFAQPVVELAVDGVSLARPTAANRYQSVDIQIPPRPGASGLTLIVTSEPTFVPTASDPRQLGVRVDRLECRPVGLPLPPVRVVAAAAMTGAVFAAGVLLIGATGIAALAATAIVGAVESIPLTRGTAPYSPYVTTVPWLAGFLATAVVATSSLVSRVRKQPLDAGWRFVLAFAGAAVFLELLVLLHPEKQTVDAVFHAHRLGYVLSGQYFFTQPMPDGVRFPYAVGLYVVAGLFSGLTTDYVTLLKVVVTVSRALAGIALFPMVRRSWLDDRTAALAVVLFFLVPLPFVIIGNANYTYAFGQATAVLTLAAAATWPLERRNVVYLALLFGLCSLALLSHVGIFPLLVAILLVTAVLFRVAGGPPLRPAAGAITAITLLAIVFSVAVYYGHFPESYETLHRVVGSAEPAAASPGPDVPLSRVPPLRAPTRVLRAADVGVRAFGWPIVLLAGVGAWRVWCRGARDRVTLLIAATAVAYVVFAGFAAVMPVEPRFQRYTEEFIGRVNYTAMPAAVILAACGAAWMWARGVTGRTVLVVLFTWAVLLAGGRWAADILRRG